MRNLIAGIINGFLHRRTLRRWERLGQTAQTISLDQLRDIRTTARALSERVTSVLHTAEMRLTRPVLGSNAMLLPGATDWSYRPLLWAGPVVPPGFAPARNKTEIGQEVTVFHDCKEPGLSIRQIRNTRSEDLAPCGLQMDIFNFDGSFLSLVLKAPDEIVKDLQKKHVIRLTLRLESERPIEINARLNLKNGPNTEQVSHHVKHARDGSSTEFDLAYVPFNPNKAEHIWIDLFFDSPEMNQVTIYDLTLSRHPRAEL